ncbi:UDP-N-acetylglucosamine 2-epimerase [Winogradskyella sp.]
MKKIVFLTGTRADFGKIKPLLIALENHRSFEVFIFVTGMHLMPEYGYTLIEIERCGFTNIKTFKNHTSETTMDLTMAKTIEGFSSYVNEINPDLIVIHGDRIEALAGAAVGSLNNYLVAHIEGGELSGTIDELIRHSVSKLSHIHFVSNNEAKNRLLQMGEIDASIYVIGSPDVDIMFSDKLPSLTEVKKYYEITFENYGLAMFHPVTTEENEMKKYAEDFVNALCESKKNFVVIFPNNDLGSTHILRAYKKIKNHPRFRIFPSLRFEYFLTLLKKADFMIGNSSAGVREAPYYDVPTINIGSRQKNRVFADSICNIGYDKESIVNAIKKIEAVTIKSEMPFGEGNSAEKFLNCIQDDEVWKLSHQKQFQDLK